MPRVVSYERTDQSRLAAFGRALHDHDNWRSAFDIFVGRQQFSSIVPSLSFVLLLLFAASLLLLSLILAIIIAIFRFIAIVVVLGIIEFLLPAVFRVFGQFFFHPVILQLILFRIVVVVWLHINNPFFILSITGSFGILVRFHRILAIRSHKGKSSDCHVFDERVGC